MRTRNVILAAAAVASACAASALAGRSSGAPHADAAAPKPAIDVSFGPGAVEASSSPRFLLSVRNSGAAAANLALGDRVDVLFGTGTLSTDLTTDASPLAASPGAPAGFAELPITDGTGARIGTRLQAQGAVQIAAGDAIVVEMRGATPGAGIAPVAVELALSKTAGKFLRRSEFRVLKSAPVSDLSFYGDGADGDLVVLADTALQPLRSYANVRIATGVRVTVPSGTTIRCSGEFENRGTIVVDRSNHGGFAFGDAPAAAGTWSAAKELSPVQRIAERGDALSSPDLPAVQQEQAASGAVGGRGLGTRVFALPLASYRTGGGGGTGTFSAAGGAGGGLIRIVARGEIRNGGTIDARGETATSNRTTVAVGGGCGAGGGGIVILASGALVRNDVPANANGDAAGGTVDVRGGDGGPVDFLGGHGGGGGGGLVVFCAPTVGAFGTNRLDGGMRFTGSPTLAGPIWAGGGGGGACAGDGGDGSGVSAAGVVDGIPAVGGGTVVPGLSTPGQLVVRTSDPRSIW